MLTDADFGRAYLTQGWARRFVQQLFSKFVVLFVGYSHQDLPLLYLARGISAAEDGPGRYALTSPFTADTDWLNLGITPVHYPLRVAPLAPHGALGDCLAEWADIANLGSLGTEARIKGHSDVGSTPQASKTKTSSSNLCWMSVPCGTSRGTLETLRWLEWISELPVFSAIFISGVTLSESSAELAFWFAEQFAIPHFAVLRSILSVASSKRSLPPSGDLWPPLGQFHSHAHCWRSPAILGSDLVGDDAGQRAIRIFWLT